jgi:ADP-ribose pyrophosphatase
MPKGSWQTLSSKIVYQNHWIKLREDKVVQPGGEENIYSDLEKPPGVFIIPVDSDGSIYLIRQYRYPVKKFIYEIPAGTVDAKNSLLSNAKRELFEETGLTAKKWRKLGSYFAAAGHENLKIYTFLATDLDLSTFKLTHHDDDELITKIFKVTPAKLKKMISQNKIECGITLASLCYLFNQK